jgi:hypothetical protein
MRKLFAVIAVLAFIVSLGGCGSSSDHPASAHKQTSKEMRSGSTNITAEWFRPYGEGAPFIRVQTLSEGEWVKSAAVSFSTTAKGIRLIRAPQTKVVEIEAWYAKRNHPYRWDGNGQLPRTKTITSLSGKQHQRQLEEITAYLYNGRIPEARTLHFRR